MPIKVNKLDNKTFTPTGEEWAGSTTTEASAVKYEDKGADVYPNLVKESGGKVVWAKPFKLTITKVGEERVDTSGATIYDWPQAYFKTGYSVMDDTTSNRINTLEPTKPDCVLPMSDDYEGETTGRKKSKFTWNKSIFQGDTLVLRPNLTSTIGYEIDSVTVNGEDGTKYVSDGVITIPVNDSDIDVVVSSKRRKYDVDYIVDIESTLGTTVTTSVASGKFDYNSAILLVPGEKKFYWVDQGEELSEIFKDPAILSHWTDYVHDAVSLEFNHYYSWCNYTYTITSTREADGVGFVGVDWYTVSEADVAANPALAPYLGFQLVFLNGDRNRTSHVGESAKYRLHIVETPLLTDVTVQFTASDNPVDYYGENATNWAYLCTDRTHATKINPAVLKDVQIGDTLRLSVNNVSDVCEVKMEFIHEGTVTNTYYLRYDDSDDTQGEDLYSNYFYDIYVNGDSWGPVLTKDWTITKDTVITVDVEHRYKDFSIYFEKDSTNKYGDWDNGQTRNKIPTLTTWSISDRVVTLTLPTDYVTRYGGASYYTDKFIAYEDDEQYSYTWHAIYMDDSSSTAITGTFMNDDSHEFYGNVSREVNNYTISLVDFEDESGESNNWAHWYLKKGSDAEVVVTSMTVPYGTTFKCEALSDDPDSLRLLWSPDGGISWWGEEGDETQYICRPIDDTAQYDYNVFTCWLKNMTSVTGDGAIAAQVDRTTKKYKINLKVATGSADYGDWYTANDGGTVVTDTGELDYGTQCMLLYTPGDDFGTLAVGPNTARYYFRPKTRSAQYKYTASFDIATQTSFNVTGDMTITGSMTRATAKYKITVDTDNARWTLSPTQPTDGYEYGTSVTILAETLTTDALYKFPYSIYIDGSPVSCTTKYTTRVNGEENIPYGIYTTVTMGSNIKCTAAYRSCYEAMFAESDYDNVGDIYFYKSDGTWLRTRNIDYVGSTIYEYMTTDVYATFTLTCNSRTAYDEVTANGGHTYYGSGDDEKIICSNTSGKVIAHKSDGFTITTCSTHSDGTYLEGYYVSNDALGFDTLYDYVYVEGKVVYNNSNDEQFYLNTIDTRGALLTFAAGSPTNPEISIEGESEGITFTSGAPAFIMGPCSGSATYTLSAKGYTVTPSTIDLGDCGTNEYELSFTTKNYNITTSSDSNISWSVPSTATYGSTVTGTITAINQCYFGAAPTFVGVSDVILTLSDSIIVATNSQPIAYSFSFTMPANDVTIKVTSNPRYGILNIKNATYIMGTIFYQTGETESIETTDELVRYYNYSIGGVKWNLTAMSRLVYSSATYGGHGCFGCQADDRIITDLGYNSTGSDSAWLSQRWLGSETVYETVKFNNTSGDWARPTDYSTPLNVGTNSCRDSVAAPITNSAGMTTTLNASDLGAYAKTIASGVDDIFFAPYSNRNVTFTLADSHYNMTLTSGGSTITNPVSFRDSSSSPGNTITITSAPKSYTISCSADNVTCTGGGTYTYGSSCTITASANSGYVMKNWSGWVGQDLLEVEGTNYCTNCTYTFTVTGDWAISPDFQATAYHSFSFEADEDFPVNYDLRCSNGYKYSWTSSYTSIDDLSFYFFSVYGYLNIYSRSHSSSGWISDGVSSYYGNGTDDRIITGTSNSGGGFFSTKIFDTHFYPSTALVYAQWQAYASSPCVQDVSISLSSTDSRSGYLRLSKHSSQPWNMHIRAAHANRTVYVYTDRFLVAPYSTDGTVNISGNTSDALSTYNSLGDMTLADMFNPKSSSTTKYICYGNQGSSGGGQWLTTYGWKNSSWRPMSNWGWGRSCYGWILCDSAGGNRSSRNHLGQLCLYENDLLNGEVWTGDCYKTLKIAWWGYAGSTSRYFWRSSTSEDTNVYQNDISAGVHRWFVDTNNNNNGGTDTWGPVNGDTEKIQLSPWGMWSDASFSYNAKVKVAGSYYWKWTSSSAYSPTLYMRGIYSYKRQTGDTRYYWTFGTFTSAL